jgi:N-acetylglutamate synthase-like GNAT family acetyltransferase
VTSRILPPAEWPRLAGTEAEALWPHLDPANAQVLVVEQDGEIVGTWTLLRIVHVECVWIREDCRGRFGVVKRLLSGMRAAARQWGARTVLTASLTDQVRSLVTSLGGQPLPGEHFVIPLEGPCRPQ